MMVVPIVRCDDQYFGGGCCVGNKLNLFLNATRCFEYLSNGLNRAGCPDCVALSSGDLFYYSINGSINKNQQRKLLQTFSV